MEEEEEKQEEEEEETKKMDTDGTPSSRHTSSDAVEYRRPVSTVHHPQQLELTLK